MSDADHCKINEVVTHFRGCESTVTKIAPPTEGRNAGSNHLVLTCDDDYVLSIKKQFQSADDTSRELFIKDVTDLLQIRHYKIIKQNNFPLPNWSCDYVKMEWGKNGRKRRLNLNEIASGKASEAKQSVMENIQDFLGSYAAIFAVNFHFAVSDRKGEHFLWDLEDKIVYSIDNEIIGGVDYREDIRVHSNVIKSVLGPKWFDNNEWTEKFGEQFLQLSEKIRGQREKIREVYTKNCLVSDMAIFETRIATDPKTVLSQFLT